MVCDVVAQCERLMALTAVSPGVHMYKGREERSSSERGERKRRRNGKADSSSQWADGGSWDRARYNSVRVRGVHGAPLRVCSHVRRLELVGARCRRPVWLGYNGFRTGQDRRTSRSVCRNRQRDTPPGGQRADGTRRRDRPSYLPLLYTATLRRFSHQVPVARPPIWYSM